MNLYPHFLEFIVGFCRLLFVFSIIIKFPVLAASPYIPSPTLIRFIAEANSSETPSWATSSNSLLDSSEVNNRVTSEDINSLTRCTAFSKTPPRLSEPYNVAEIALSIPKRFSLIVSASRLCCNILRVLSSSVTNRSARTFSLFFDDIKETYRYPDSHDRNRPQNGLRRKREL